MMKSKPLLRATVFTDYICPFCYVGDVRLQRLREYYDLKINWCFVEIHPETPAEGMPTRSLGYDASLWRQMMDNLGTLAGEEDIRFRPHDFTTNSRKALLLAEAAKEEGGEIFYRVHRRLFEAFFAEGKNIADEEVLQDIATQAGARERTLRRALEEERYRKRLQQYLVAAHELEVRATPTIFFGEQQRLDGALPFSVFQKVARAGAAAQNADNI